jgi:hypothetical protein
MGAIRFFLAEEAIMATNAIIRAAVNAVAHDSPALATSVPPKVAITHLWNLRTFIRNK